uniref:COS46.2 n=1 Tax=Ciona intestinalis TaxID=7719 RepID=P91588_CIOIN|nr:COS46.2 [Ciona intestinalis]
MLYSRNISSSSVDIDIPRHDVTTDNYDVGQFNELSTIIQSPVEPFYSSSSLESLSEGESGKPKISENDVIRHQKWPTSEEHKETRDWLISKSSPPPQNEYIIKKIPNVIEKSKVFNQISDVNNSVDISIPKVISSTPSYMEQPSNGPTSTVPGTEDGRVAENEPDVSYGEENKQPEEQQPDEAANHISPVLPKSLHNSNDVYPVFSEELQDFPAEFPNTSVVLPDSAVMLPDTFPVLPDSAAVLPDTSPMLQDSPAGLPDTSAVLPDAPQVPPDSPEVPQVASLVLPLSIEIPSEKTNVETLETAEPKAEVNEEITHSSKGINHTITHIVWWGEMGHLFIPFSRPIW